MRKNIELYINNQLVDLSEDFEVNMTYTIEQTTNPTAIRNNYSKTITIPATGNNNRILGNIWNMTSIYNNDFDLTKKADFQLFVNGDKFEEGYIKIDNVIKNEKGVEYKCTLYGSLGDFFYSLSTNNEGEKLKLSDLDYGGGKYEFDLLVNKNVIYDAWYALMNDITEGTIYDDINFALCYNGLPDNFNANKVLINTKEQGPFNIPDNIIQDGNTYTAKNGWVLGDLRQEYDEWAARDLRSYLQRPVFRVKTLFRGICNPENNNGYEVRLDETFFNSNNPYWEKAWITLPLINEMDEISAFNVNTTEFVINAPFNDGDGDDTNIKVTYELCANAQLQTDTLVTGLIWSLNTYNMTYDMPVVTQLVGIKNGQYVHKSKVHVFSNQEFHPNNYVKNGFDGEYERLTGVFKRYEYDTLNRGYIFTTNNYDMEFEFNISIDDDYRDYEWRILLGRWEYSAPDYKNFYGETYYDCLLIPSSSSETGNKYDGDNSNLIKRQANTISLNINANVDLVKVEDINKRKLTKERMLGKDKTPLDYLLGYTKQFGLYFLKDPKSKTIDIVTRNTFYGKRNVIDLQDSIDTSKEITITPLTFDRKWYDMGLEIEDNKYSEKYDKYSIIPYGTKRIDTGYEYIKDKQSLLQNNAYKGGMMVREKGAYYVNYRLPKK